MSAIVGKLSSNSALYHCKDREQKYDMLDEMPTSFWFGKGAESLGLKGSVDRKTFRKLLWGYSPDGTGKLVQNAGLTARQEGSEFVFSVPSTLAALFAASNDNRKAEILKLIVKCASQSLSYVEALFSFTRRGSAGRDIERIKGLVVAAFVDIDNRNNQSMPHVHCCILNSAERLDGTWGAIINKPFYLVQAHLGRVFHALLAEDLSKELRLKVVRNDGSFEIDGVPSNVTPLLVGSRKKEITATLQATGRTGASAAERAAKITRRKKIRVPTKDLFERWQKVGSLVNFTEPDAERLYGSIPSHHLGVDETLKKFADVEWEKIDVSCGDKVDREGQDPSRLTNDPNGKEQKIPYFMVDKVLAQKKWQSLSAEQKHAAERLTVSKDQVVILEAVTGTGKDQVLSAAKEIWNECGYKVIATSPSARHSQAFEESTRMKTKPIGRLFDELESTIAKRILHHIHQMGRAILNKPTWKIDRTTLDSNTVVIVDHGVLLGRKTISSLVNQCDSKGAKLVLVSDPVIRKGIKSHYIKGMVDNFETAKLTNIKRQTCRPEKEAVEFLARGDLSRALEVLSHSGKLTTAYDPISEMLNAWKIQGVKYPRDHVLIVDTREVAREVNYEAQRFRRNARKCGGKSFMADATDYVGVDWKKALSLKGALKEYLTFRTERELTQVYVGDRVVCTKEYGIKGIRSGMTGTIEKISSGKHPKVWINLDSGKKISFHVETYKSFRLAYAFSAKDLDGRTVKNAYVPLTHSSKLIAYQQLSRASESTQVAVPPEMMYPNLARQHQATPSINRPKR